jgi:putative glutamine amidotransferase
VNQRYILALAETAGVLPMIVPALGARLDFADLVKRLDGLLVTGSPSNVEPHHYGCCPAAPDILHDRARDATTLPLLREALQQGLPVFAVCRGIQELNVVMGGTLHQFLHEVPGKHDHRSDKSKPITERAGPAHPVSLAPDGLLARLAGATEVMVNSLHAQGIDRLGDGLVVEAVSPDGVIEAVRVKDAKDFAVGVQWHPECLQTDPLARALFEAFGAAARERAARRRAMAAAAA